MGDILDIGSIVGAIELEDRLSPAVKMAVGQMLGLGDVADKVGSKLAEAGEQAAKSGNVIVGAFKLVAGATAAVVGGVTAIATSIMGLATRGSRLVGIEDSFHNIAKAAGVAGDELLNHLNKALKGTVDQTDQMEALSKALSAGMKLTTKDMDVLGATARAMARATGGDAASALDMLTASLTRGRDRTLQTIGIRINAQEAERKYAESIGTTADKLNAIGSLEAKRGAMLEEMAKYVAKAGDAELSLSEMLTKARLAIENWFDDVAKAVARNPMLQDAFEMVVAALGRIFTPDLLQGGINLVTEGVNRFAEAVMLAVPYLEALAQKVRDFWDWLVKLNERYDITGKAMRAVEIGLGLLKDALSFVKSAADAVIRTWEAMPEWMQKTAQYAALSSIGFYAIGKAVEASASAFSEIVRTVDTYINITTNALASGSLLTQLFEKIGGSTGIAASAIRGFAFTVGMVTRPVETLRVVFDRAGKAADALALAQRSQAVAAEVAGQAEIALMGAQGRATAARTAMLAAQARVEALRKEAIVDTQALTIAENELAVAATRSAEAQAAAALSQSKSLVATKNLTVATEGLAIAETAAGNAAKASWASLIWPITLVVTAWAGLTYAIAKVTDSWKAAFGIMLPPVGIAMQAIENFKLAWVGLKEEFPGVTAAAKGALDGFVAVLSGIKSAVTATASFISDLVVVSLNTWDRWIRNSIGAIWGWVKSIGGWISSVGKWIGQLIADIAEDMQFSDVKVVMHDFGGIVEYIASKLTTLNPLMEKFEKFAGWLAGLFKGAMSEFKGWVDYLHAEAERLRRESERRQVEAGLKPIPSRTAIPNPTRVAPAMAPMVEPRTSPLLEPPEPSPDQTTYTQEVRALIAELSGVKAVQGLNVLSGAFRGLSDAQRQNMDIVGDVIDRYVALSAQIRDLPKSLQMTRAEFEGMALSVPKFTLPKDWLGQARGMMLDAAGVRATEQLGSLFELWKRMPPEIANNKAAMAAVVQKYIELRGQVRELPSELAAADAEFVKMATSAQKVRIGPDLLGQIYQINKQMAGGDAVQRMLAINAAWHNQSEEVRNNVTMQRQWGAEFASAWSGAKNVPAWMASVIKEMQPLMAQAGTFAMEIDRSFSLTTVAPQTQAALDRAEKYWMDYYDFQRQTEQVFVRDSMSATSQRALEIIKAEELIRKASALTDAERNLSRSRELLNVGQLIASQQNWRGELNLTIAQLKAYGTEIPEDKLRSFVELLAQAQRHRFDPDTLIAKLKELELGIPNEELELLAKRLLALRGTATSAVTGFAGLSSSLDTLSGAFSQLAQISGGAFSGAAQSIGTIISSANLGMKSFSGIKSSWKSMTDAFKTTGADGKKSILGMASGVLEFAGSIGSAISAVLSFGKAIKDAFDPPNWKRAIDEIKRTWAGVGEISESVAKQIEADMDKVFRGMKNNRWAAEVYNLGKIIDDVGLSAKNFTSLLGQMRNAFSFMQQGTFTADQAVKVLNDSFGKFVDFLGGNVTPALKEIIKLSDEFGLKSKAIADYVDREANKAATALGSIITRRGGIVDALGEAQKKLDDLVKAKGIRATDLATLLKTGKLDGDLKAAYKEVLKLQQQLGALPPLTAESAEAYGGALLGIFSRLTKDGASAIEVAKQLQPAVESLEKQLGAAGKAQRAPIEAALDRAKKKLKDLLDARDLTPLDLQKLLLTGKIDKDLRAAYDAVASLQAQLAGLPAVGGPAFDQIKSMVALATDEIAGPALQSVQDLGTALEGLNNANILTPEMFKGLADQVGATVDNLLKQGKTMNEIYPFVQSSLQTIWELQQDYGYEVDQTTQDLLNQAEAEGKVGDKHRSVQEQMLLAMQDVRDVLIGIGEYFGVTLPQQAKDGAEGVQDALDGIHSPGPIDINYRYKQQGPGMPGSEQPEPGDQSRRNAPPMMTGGIVQPVYAQTGVFTPKGSDVVPAMLTPGEGVISQSGMDRLSKLILDLLNGKRPTIPREAIPPVKVPIDYQIPEKGPKLPPIMVPQLPVGGIFGGIFSPKAIQAILDKFKKQWADDFEVPPLKEPKGGLLPPKLQADALDAIRALYEQFGDAVPPDLMANLLDQLQAVRDKFGDAVPDFPKKKWETYTDQYGQIWTVVGGFVGKVKGDLNSVNGLMDLLGTTGHKAMNEIGVAVGNLTATQLADLQHTLERDFPGAFDAMVRTGAFDDLGDKFSDVSGDAEQAARDARAALLGIGKALPPVGIEYDVPDFPTIEPPTVTVPVEYDVPPIPIPEPVPIPGGGSSGGTGGSSGVSPDGERAPYDPYKGRGPDGYYGAGGVVYAASGLFMPRGSDVVPAMLTPGEGVLTVGAMDRLGRLALDALNAGTPLVPSHANEAPGTPMGGGDYSRHLPAEARSADVTIVIQALDPRTIRDVVERDVAPVLNDVWRRNSRQSRTDARNALGV